TYANRATAAILPRRRRTVRRHLRSADAEPTFAPTLASVDRSTRAPSPIVDGTSTGSAKPCPAPTPPRPPAARANARFFLIATESGPRRTRAWPRPHPGCTLARTGRAPASVCNQPGAVSEDRPG